MPVAGSWFTRSQNCVDLPTHHEPWRSAFPGFTNDSVRSQTLAYVPLFACAVSHLFLAALKLRSTVPLAGTAICSGGLPSGVIESGPPVAVIVNVTLPMA